MNKLITIVGPTAVGKTALTLSLAEYLGTEVISGDAYQVYRGLNIGSAKPTVEELNLVKHHLIDIIEPYEKYSVAEFKVYAEELIKQINDLGKIPILSGGTGLYVQSLLENYNFAPTNINEALREKLNDIYLELGDEGLLDYAKSLASKYDLELPFTDKHRLYRAIELLEAGKVEYLINQTKQGLSYQGPVIGLRRERSDLYKRINLRVDLMLKDGLLAEVEYLYKNGLKEEHQAMKGIGYKEFLPYFSGECSLNEVIENIKKNTRHFAKRQITWYKRMPYIKWIDINPDMSEDSILEKVKEIINMELER